MLLFLQVVKAGFNTNYGLMGSTAEGLAYPQPAAAWLPQGVALLEFLGLMLAKALYEGILLDYPLAPFFVARCQSARSTPEFVSFLAASRLWWSRAFAHLCSRHSGRCHSTEDRFKAGHSSLERKGWNPGSMLHGLHVRVWHGECVASVQMC